MIEIVINYDTSTSSYKVYEPSTDTLLVSNNLTEALVNLSHFLVVSGFIEGDILSHPEISYHLDSHTMKTMIESNASLIKQIKQGPSGFMTASQRFGGSGTKPIGMKDSQSSFTPRKSSSFSGESGFKKANKKFGSK